MQYEEEIRVSLARQDSEGAAVAQKKLEEMSAGSDAGVGIACLPSEIEAETRRQAAAYEEEIRGLLALKDFSLARPWCRRRWKG